MTRQISEERIREEHAHKKMIGLQLEKADWYLHEQSIFLQKRHLKTTDLYEPPLDLWRGCGGAVVYGEGNR